jgi:hypothetical protein
MVFRVVVWFILVLGGVAGVIVALAFLELAPAAAIGVAVVASWVAWGVFTAWLYGVKRHVVRHLGEQWFKGTVLTHTIRTGERINVQIALDRLRKGEPPRAPMFGMPVDSFSYNRFGELAEPTTSSLVAVIMGNPEPLPLTWERLPAGNHTTRNCVNNALYLLRWRDQPFCVFVQGRSRGPRKTACLQVLARTEEAAQAALDEILRLSREHSAYKGCVVSIERMDRKGDDFSVQFLDLPVVERDAIILPERVLEVIERNVLGFLAYAEALRQAGCATRHGVLLHGPPGTGKTLVARYLARIARGYTVLVVTGRQYGFLRQTCQLARLLAPSLVILEDVDLVAVERRRNRNTPLLHDLMDEMDGIGTAADCIFLLTTNQPQAVEPALAARPGRVDQAIHFPLPDLECRRRLFGRFGKGMNLASVELETLLRRTEGASPAFIQELCRRAVLMAAERGERSQPLRLLTVDFELALRELVEYGGELTRSFLGFPAHEAAAGCYPLGSEPSSVGRPSQAVRPG